MSVENKPKSVISKYSGRLIKVGVLVFFSLLMMMLYVKFFQHPPPRQMLLNNQRVHHSFRGADFGASLFRDQKQKEANDEDNDDDDKDEENDDADTEDASLGFDKETEDSILRHKKRELGISEEVKMSGYWNNFLKKMNFVPIGAVYNKCKGPGLVQLGIVVLMEDKESGGVKARTYVNITLDKTVDGGRFNIDSKYNGNSLYDNYWDLCDVEDDLPDEEKTFLCPLKPGTYTRVKDKVIPSFLPKGTFQSKIWATDQDGDMLGCGFSEFKI